MTKQSLEMESRPWGCRVCGSANDGISTHCFQCGHPGFFSRSQRQTRPSLSPTRRNVLIGGLVSGAALLGGGGTWLARHVVPGWPRPISPTLEIQLDPRYLLSPALAWSPDGLSIACSSTVDPSENEDVIVVDVNNGQKKWTWSSLSFSALAWSPDGKFLTIAGSRVHSQSFPTPFVQVWQVQGWQRLVEYPSVSGKALEEVSFQQLAWSPDKSRIAVVLFRRRTNAYSVQIWRASDGQVLLTRQMPAALNLLPFMICWLPDSKMLATSGREGEVAIWDTDTGESVFHHAPDHPLGDDPQVRVLFAGPGATLSPDKKRVALYTLENGQPIIQVWDISSRKLLFRCQPVDGQQGGLTWSPDGKYLAAYKNDHGQTMIHLWDAGSGELSITYGTLYAPAVLTWSPDGRFLAYIDRRQPFFMHAPPTDTVLRIFQVG